MGKKSVISLATKTGVYLVYRAFAKDIMRYIFCGKEVSTLHTLTPQADQKTVWSGEGISWGCYGNKKKKNIGKRNVLSRDRTLDPSRRIRAFILLD